MLNQDKDMVCSSTEYLLSVRPIVCVCLKTQLKHGVPRSMISMDIFYLIFEIIIFSFVVAICDLVPAAKAMYGLP